jgi:hypothetical protein
VSSEALAKLLAEHDGRFAVMSPGGGVFELMAGRYSANGAPNFEVYLKGHAGDTLLVDRVSRSRERIVDPALSVGLAVQPEVISGLADKPGFRGKGLLARFLYAVPESLVGYRKSGAAVPEAVRADYRQKVRALLELRLTSFTSSELIFTAAARAEIETFEAEIQVQLRDFEILGELKDWGSKLPGAVARLCGILHMAHQAEQLASLDVSISLETVRHAIIIGRYLIPHAIMAFGMMGDNALVADAKTVLRWIEKNQTLEVSKREIYRGIRPRFKQVDELDPVLIFLVGHGYLRTKDEPKWTGPGRKSSLPIYQVHPTILGPNRQNGQNLRQLVRGADGMSGHIGRHVAQESVPAIDGDEEQGDWQLVRA